MEVAADEQKTHGPGHDADNCLGGATTRRFAGPSLVRAPTIVQSGCLRVRLLQDADDRNAITWMEEWDSEDALKRHILTDEYRTLLAVIDMSTREPEVRFHTVAKTAGMDLIAACRTKRIREDRDMRGNRASGIAIALALAAAPALGKDFYVYPQKGQSAEQQEKDEFDCFKWAKQQSGFDPMNAASSTTTTTMAPPPPATQGGTVKGAARGAAVGAVGGAIGGDAGKGAAIGAGTGALIGTMRRRDAERQQSAQQQYRQQQAQSSVSAARSNFDRAYSACMEGRGYTVK